MIGNIARPKSRSLHRLHTKRNRFAWILMATIVATSCVFVVGGYFTGVPWSVLIDSIMHTTYRLAVAYGIAVVLGTSVALVVGWSPFMDIFFPIFDILQNIPSFALFPLFIYFLGHTDLMIILFAVTSIVWPILFAILTAIKSAHKDLNDAATIFGATEVKRITHYLAPLSLPAVLTGSIVGIAIGWEAVIGAEIIANTQGFGTFIKDTDVTGVSPSAIAGAIAILVIVFVINRLIWAPLLLESGRRYAE